MKKQEQIIRELHIGDTFYVASDYTTALSSIKEHIVQDLSKNSINNFKYDYKYDYNTDFFKCGGQDYYISNNYLDIVSIVKANIKREVANCVEAIVERSKKMGQLENEFLKCDEIILQQTKKQEEQP